jgi:hypothetical protein
LSRCGRSGALRQKLAHTLRGNVTNATFVHHQASLLQDVTNSIEQLRRFWQTHPATVGDWAGVGDFNGDGYSDIAVHDGANVQFNVLKNTQSSGFTGGTWLNGWTAGDWAGVGDVNGP